MTVWVNKHSYFLSSRVMQTEAAVIVAVTVPVATAEAAEVVTMET